MITHHVDHPTGSYPVHIGAGLAETLADVTDGRIIVVTDDHIASLYRQRLAQIDTLIIPTGEQYKSLATAQQLYGQLIERGADRQTTLVAFGGGVVGDLTGFVAATYMRGMPFVQSPTSLLAMVDASVGGKTGVDLPEGKNLVGAFKQPEAVIIDVATLHTLDAAEFSAGMAEVIKHTLLADPALFEQIEQGTMALTPTSTDADLERLVARSVAVKIDVVQRDPFETLGVRALLNFGHTFGHALEHVSGYRLRHGEAVGLGMLVATRVSAKLAHCDPTLVPRLAASLSHVGLPTSLSLPLDVDALIHAMQSDKKKKKGRLRFILIKDVGKLFIAHDVPERLIRAEYARLMEQ